jgi:hypothetical protein
MPYEIMSSTRYEIKTVVYPDDSKRQMYMIDGRPYSVTEKWGKIVDENEFEVEVLVPKKMYYGISYDGDSFNPKISLVKKEKR